MSETTATLTRRYRFAASHRLHAMGLSDEENTELYGKCNNPFGHGHDYVLDISVAGPIDGRTGKMFVGDALDRLVERAVLSDFRYRNLNSDVAEFGSLVPTTENISLVIAERLKNCWYTELPIGTRLARICIEETARNSFEVDCFTTQIESLHA